MKQIKTIFKKGDEISIKQRFKERKILLKPFLKLYKKPIITHAVYDKTIFKKILIEGKIKFR